MKYEYYILALIIVVLVILIFIYNKKPEEKIEIVEKATITAESDGSGFLEVETFPGGAEIFVDSVYREVSPVTLYNIPSGEHEIIIKKEGYEDLIEKVNIEAGRRTFLELELIRVVEEVKEVIEEQEVIEDKEVISLKDLKSGGIVNIGDKFTLYYDFSEGEFSNNKQALSDIFSKRFDTYLVFTRLSPTNIKVVDKDINSVTKEDCVGIKDQFEYLYSRQSLCVTTRENDIVAIGGYWDNTKNVNLTWKIFS